MSATKFDKKILYQLEYGLYVLTVNDGKKDNGCIVNTVMQVASTPVIIAVGVNKQNYTCEVIQKTGVLNINTLTKSASFELFKNFGFQSGKDVDKFDDCSFERSENGLPILIGHTKGFISLVVEDEIDLGSHILFLCKPTDGKTITDRPGVTYSYYQEHIKPKPKQAQSKGFMCKVCGYIYKGETLPDDYICPICKHGADDFITL